MGLLRQLIRQLREQQGQAASQPRHGRRRSDEPEPTSHDPAAADAAADAAAPTAADAPPPDDNGRGGGRRERKTIGDRVEKIVHAVQEVKNDISAGGYAKEGADVEGQPKGAVPSEPHNALTKRRSYYGMLLIAFVLSADWTATLMSIQALYYLLNGPKHLYGVAFASYDIAMLAAVVFYTAWNKATGSFKAPILFAALVSLGGCVAYSFTVLANRWWMILIGRAIQGCGAAAVYLGSPYCAATTATYEEQDTKDNKLKAVQNGGQQLVMLAGMIWMGMNTVMPSSNDATKVFNFYTMNSWLVAFALVLVVLPGFTWLFTDPTKENEHLVEKAEDANVPPPTPAQEARVRSLGLQFITLSFFTVFSMVAFLCNLFALKAAQYHKIHDQSDMFNAFLPVGIGSIIAGFAYKVGTGEKKSRLNGLIPKCLTDERALLPLGNWLLFAAWMLTIPWGGKTSTPNPWLYYVGAACCGGVTVLFFIGLSKFTKAKLKQYRAVDKAKGTIFKLLGPVLLTAKFAGPIVIGAVTYIATPDGRQRVCTGAINNDICTFAPGTTAADQCIVLGDQYYVDGCILYNAIYFYPIMAGVALVVTLGFHLLVKNHWSYTD